MTSGGHAEDEWIEAEALNSARWERRFVHVLFNAPTLKESSIQRALSNVSGDDLASYPTYVL